MHYADFAPHGHWNTTTLVAALSLKKPVAPMVFDNPRYRLSFDAFSYAYKA